MNKGRNLYKINKIKNNTSSAREEIRFIKDQQWKPVYYPLYLFSAIIIIYANKIIEPTNQYYCLLKWLAIALVGLVGIVSISWQWWHFNSLQEYRLTPGIGKTTEKTIKSVMITVTFSLITVVGTAFALFYLLG